MGGGGGGDIDINPAGKFAGFDANDKSDDGVPYGERSETNSN